MENENLSLATKQWNYEKAYNQSYKLACEQLAKIGDIEEQCRRSGAQYQPDKSGVLLQYLNQSYLISLPGGEVSLVGSTEMVPVRDRILILHYFNSAKGTPLTNKLITLRELPEGGGYFPTFFNRTSQPILHNFGREPKLLLKAAEVVGGRQVDYGDAAVTIDAFSRVPVTIILWGGDDELAPQGNVVFDASISDYLCTEDIVVLCETITWKLVRSLKKA
ncbi:MAG: DUF3786 domain-containing protein [Chloroflexi bacterium]|nr:DUF3786 domain-containing protein [Chloroflexota bacterium]